MSTTPSMRVVKNTPARVGDQQPPVRYDLQYLVVIMGALPSSDQMRAVQSPTVMKNLEKLHRHGAMGGFTHGKTTHAQGPKGRGPPGDRGRGGGAGVAVRAWDWEACVHMRACVRVHVHVNRGGCSGAASYAGLRWME
jgi:hypothetical protein